MLKNILIVLLFLGFNVAKAQIFEATGIGDTPEMAKKDAVANAIKFSVGEFMLNKEELTNEDLNQKIVSYSNAYVKRINVISQEKINHSEYKVNVEVDIESQKLIGALKEMQIAVIENAVDSDTLLEAINHFDKNDINKQNKENFGELVEELLIKPIKEHKELIEVKTIGKLKPLQPKGNSDHFPLQLDLSISPTKEYIYAFKRILKEAKSDKSSGIPVYEQNLNSNQTITSSPHKTKTYYFDKEKSRIYMDKFDNIDKSKDYRALIVDLIDKDGESIKEIEFCSDFNRCYNNRIKFIKNNEDLYLGLNYGSALLPSISRDYGSFFTGKAKVKVILILTKEEIIKLKDIQVRFSD